MGVTGQITYKFYVDRAIVQGGCYTKRIYRGLRKKHCAVCSKDWKIMYRIKYKEGADWVFACREMCLRSQKRNPIIDMGALGNSSQILNHIRLDSIL